LGAKKDKKKVIIMDKLEQHRMLVANAILKDQMRKNIIKINGHNIYVEP
tara:strand:- start:282 stop:428 length:147 start_codon:yes stop_codon:yes gene_type:complete